MPLEVTFMDLTPEYSRDPAMASPASVVHASYVEFVPGGLAF
jgi:hypothetical protein